MARPPKHSFSRMIPGFEPSHQEKHLRGQGWHCPRRSAQGLIDFGCRNKRIRLPLLSRDTALSTRGGYRLHFRMLEMIADPRAECVAAIQRFKLIERPMGAVVGPFAEDALSSRLGQFVGHLLK